MPLARSLRSLAVPALLVSGCGASWEARDLDGDGFSPSEGDCWDGVEGSVDGLSGGDVFPGAGDDPNDGVDQDCDDDLDEDGFAASASEPAQLDCDDADASVNPGAQERCDGVDQDCDGSVDEEVSDAPVWYRDADGDTYGDSAQMVSACAAPDGYVADSSDCDDVNAQISPGAVEICDGLDNDCDELQDDADDSLDAASLLPWYRDADDDGYGSGADSELRCSPSEGYVEQDGDCDDADDQISPAATEECATGVVEDCDLGESGARVSCVEAGDRASATIVRYGEEADVGLAAVVAAGGDVDGDGLADLLVAAPDNTGGVFLLGGPLTVGTAALSSGAYTARWTAGGSDQLGRGLAGGEDLDEDGYDDVAMGSPAEDFPGDSNAGVAYVAFGPLSGAASASASDLSAEGPEGSAHAGQALSLGDISGDGAADLLIGAPGALSETGAVYALLGPLSAAALSLDDEFDLQWTGDEELDSLGTALAAVGDVDGDGLGDIMVGAPFNDDGGEKAGIAGLILGPASGGALLDVAGLLFRGAANDEVGSALAGPGDVNDDGYADLLIGAPTYDTDRGRVSLLLGAEYPPGSADVDDAAAVLQGSSVGDALGSALAGGFDQDGDRLDDLILGAPGADNGGSGSGALWLVSGLSEGALTMGDGEGSVISGGGASEAFGIAAAAVGDTDGDGWSDLAVGAPGYATGDSADAGAVFLFTTWY